MVGDNDNVIAKYGEAKCEDRAWEGQSTVAAALHLQETHCEATEG